MPKLWRRDALWLRRIDRQSVDSWRLVLEQLATHRNRDGAELASRNIRKLLRRRRTPALFHNGGKR